MQFHQCRIYRQCAWLVVLFSMAASKGWSCPSWYTAAYTNEQYAYSSGTVAGADPGFGLYATIHLSGAAGSDSDSSAYDFWNYAVHVNVQVALGLTDGDYTTTANYYHVFPPEHLMALAAPQVETKTVDPWLKITSSSKESGNIPTSNGKKKYMPKITTSANCYGPVQMYGFINKDPGTSGFEVSIGKEGDAWVSGRDGIVLLPVTVPAASQTQFTFTIATNVSNSQTGSVEAHAEVESYPSTCTLRATTSNADKQDFIVM